jgi:hypothetical protein
MKTPCGWGMSPVVSEFEVADVLRGDGKRTLGLLGTHVAGVEYGSLALVYQGGTLGC